MKTLITAIIILHVPAFSQTTTKTKKTTTAKVAAPNVVQPLVIPKDATPNADGTYAWTDKAGKKWTFAKTPFGISRMEDVTATGPAFASAPVGQFVKAFDAGDKVKFERQSPFGTTKWERNKTELNDEEKAIVAAQLAKPE